MKNISESALLSQRICILEKRQAEELENIKIQFRLVYESVKPINLLKSTLHDLTTSTDIRSDIINKVMGVSAGYLTRKILVGMVNTPARGIFGTALQFAVSAIVTRYSGNLRLFGKSVWKVLDPRKDLPQKLDLNGK